jgi:hypothetical protein
MDVPRAHSSVIGDNDRIHGGVTRSLSQAAPTSTTVAS